MARSVAKARCPTPMLLLVFVSACAGKAPLVPDTGDSDCPDLTGSYCSTGLEREEGRDGSEKSYLPYYLGVKSPSEWTTVTRVDIDGPRDGLLKVMLRVEDEEVAYAEIPRSNLICDSDRLALKMDKIPWGGAGPFLALGGSAGWRVVRRDGSGTLHIDELRRETGAFMLVIPLRIRTDTRAEFSPASENECQAW